MLFDPDATATILSNRAFVSSSCEVKIKYALDTQSAEYALELQNLQIRHDALTNEYDMRIQSMERETTALAEALRKQSKKNPVLWVVAGIAGGIAMSYTAYRVLDE